MIESETVAVGLDGVLPVLKSGVVVVVVAVPGVVLCVPAVAVITTEEALAVFVAAVNDSVVSETLSSSSSTSTSSSSSSSSSSDLNRDVFIGLNSKTVSLLSSVIALYVTTETVTEKLSFSRTALAYVSNNRLQPSVDSIDASVWQRVLSMSAFNHPLGMNVPRLSMH